MVKSINTINDIVLPENSEEKCDRLLSLGAIEVDGSIFEDNLLCVVDSFLTSSLHWVINEKSYSKLFQNDSFKRWFVLDNLKELI